MQNKSEIRDTGGHNVGGGASGGHLIVVDLTEDDDGEGEIARPPPRITTDLAGDASKNSATYIDLTGDKEHHLA